MTSVKSRAALAISTGIIISVLLAAFNQRIGDTAFAVLNFLLLPGYLAIGFLWGFHGGSVPEPVAVAVMLGINAAKNVS
jgi:hypothetical protein